MSEVRSTDPVKSLELDHFRFKPSPRHSYLEVRVYWAAEEINTTMLRADAERLRDWLTAWLDWRRSDV